MTGDYDGVRLLPFCAVYRALVRAKVDAIAAEQSPARATEFRNRLLRRVHSAIDWMHTVATCLVLMHGPSGSGKSWLSERLVAALPALRIRSDLERKRIAGTTAGTNAAAPPNEGLYVPQMSHRTYARLVESAESCLQGGFNVIVDAAFLNPADRELFRNLSLRLRTPLVIASCRADAATLSTRIQARAQAGKDPSDADRLVLEAQLRDLQPLGAEERANAITIDTREADAVQRVVAAVGACR